MKHAVVALVLVSCCGAVAGQDWWKPYSPPCTERENVFEFTEKPAVKLVGKDRYKITFAVKGYCDVTVAIVDPDPAKELVKGRGIVVRHLASGVLGPNAPPPLQKNSLRQTLIWNGKDDLDLYVKDPDKLRVQVSLGLKPEFDKLLGPANHRTLPGHVWGIGADADGVYVFFYCGHAGHAICHKFDHDGDYVKMLYPPSSTLPREKLGGMGYVEYEPGKVAVHAPVLARGMWRDGHWLPRGLEGYILRFRPAVVGGRIYLFNGGRSRERVVGQGDTRGGSALNTLNWIGTDGTTEYAGLAGKRWFESDEPTGYPSLAASPRGERMYLVGLHRDNAYGYGGKNPPAPIVVAGPIAEAHPAKIFVGSPQEPGAANDRFNNPSDVACDPDGRVYVTDTLNNRVQVFAPDGRFLRTAEIDRPELVQVHQRTGDVYVAHMVMREGRSISRLTRLAPFPDLSVRNAWDDLPLQVMTLDSWSPKPRFWVSGQSVRKVESGAAFGAGVLLRIYEEDGRELKLVRDFEEEARKQAGTDYIQWPGGSSYPVVCDPVRERAWYLYRWVFDLASGRLLGDGKIERHRPADIAFDKRGYLHIRHGDHPAPKNVVRVDPDRIVGDRCVEVPYDYGEPWEGYAGALPMPATDAQFYSWGMGVNMRGDVAGLNWIAYSPRVDEQDDLKADFSGRRTGWVDPYLPFLRRLEEMSRRGEDLFYIRPRPGIDLAGAVVWTYEATGELAKQDAAVIGRYRSNGVQIDEDGFLYFVNGRQRMFGDRLFLQDRGGNFGGGPHDPRNRSPFTGTYIKAAPGRASFPVKRPRIESDAKPGRMPDLATPGFGGGGVHVGAGGDTWAEGVEWMFAGASPIVADHCSCPHMRAALDWYKRSFVPENYRHSIGVLDANGNLILHVGRYGNFDEGGAPGRRLPSDGDGIALIRGAFVSATDNYLVISDWGHRLIVARLNCHTEETAQIRSR